jgi:hypothetical protein
MTEVQPMQLLRQKYDNMLAYVSATYPDINLAAARSAPLAAIVAAIRVHLLPLEDMLRANVAEDLRALAASLPAPWDEVLGPCARDDKLRRYALLFIELCK